MNFNVYWCWKRKNFIQNYHEGKILQPGFYIISDFKGDNPNYWEPASKTYESIKTPLIVPVARIYKNPTPSYTNNVTLPIIGT